MDKDTFPEPKLHGQLGVVGFWSTARTLIPFLYKNVPVAGLNQPRFFSWTCSFLQTVLKWKNRNSIIKVLNQKNYTFKFSKIFKNYYFSCKKGSPNRYLCINIFFNKLRNFTNRTWNWLQRTSDYDINFYKFPMKLWRLLVLSKHFKHNSISSIMTPRWVWDIIENQILWRPSRIEMKC